MNIHIHADAQNTKNILTLIEEQGFSLPCNCHGAHRCNGARYSFDCSLIPKKPMDVSLPNTSDKIQSVSLEKMETSDGTADTLLIDLGTTTIAMAFIDKESGALRQCKTSANPQAHFGSDVISRIQAATHGNLSDLTDCIRKHIKKETALLCQMTHNDISAIRFCYIGGNTTMIHLLFGYDCTSLGHSPFTIKVPSPEPLSIGNCTVYTAPWISAFVGGDITAGLLSCHLPSSGENALFLDLGTNGEMVLNHKGKLYTAATAAGPAFEGNGLSCGCPGISGAISHVVLRTLFPSLTTINNAHPIGICGSGAISLCAELLRKHYVTSDGVLTEKFKTDGIVLSKSPDGKSITFLPEDLRSIQLAIAAIAAGIDILLAESGVSKKESFTLYLGGGFGFHLSIEDCQCIGLFSDLCISEIKVMGNTCLQGLYQWSVYESTPAIQNDCVPLNLGEHPDFQKTYLHHMTFPDIR